jgi:mono/diheme cytochrome c family protein
MDMRWLGIFVGLGLVAAPLSAWAADATVKRGEHVSIVGGCHDCHTAGYNESQGKIDPATALKGIAVGWRGPWGTTYAANLRLTVKDKTEDEFVKFAKTFQTRPPMPFYNVHELNETDVRSLYMYIKSLGDPGDPSPDFVPPDQEPKTPYVTLVPPTAPKM